MAEAKPIGLSKRDDEGWVFVALRPKHLFILHTLIRLEIKKGGRKGAKVKSMENLLMAEYILEGACSSLVGTSAEE